MLNRNIFEKCISNLCYFGGVSIDKIKNNMIYQMIKDDFSDKEFSDVCLDICKTEDLYNKYPIPKMFYDRKDGCDDNNVFVCLDSGAIDISDEANNAMSKMSEPQYQRMISWMRSHIDGKTMKKSALSKIVLGFCGNTNEQIQKEEYMGISEIKKMLENHYKEEV